MTRGELAAAGGSSPRVRGAEAIFDCRPVGDGIIPACAGSSGYYALRQGSARDHPRVCGEQSEQRRPCTVCLGSSPRVRGAAVWAYTVSGISGIIPACAGSSTSSSSDKNSRRDHPRVCGEQARPNQSAHNGAGSSPRVRGAALASNGGRSQYGIIPACAGSRLKNPSSKHPIPLMWAPF